MSYNKQNKQAWEEAFDNRKAGWGEDIALRIRNESCPYLTKDLAAELSAYDLRGSTVAQFCCNNGRELLSICKLGAARGVGFDIAENQVAFANGKARELNMNCEFVAADILEIDDSYNGAFDYIFITIGALTWFDDLNAFFGKASACLKEGGHVIINEKHPVIDMFALEGEPSFDPAVPEKPVYSYFKSDPWVENGGMGYMSDPKKEYRSTFYSFSHTFEEIINAIIKSGMKIKKLKELDCDISGGFDGLSGKGIPMSYILICEK